MEEAVSTVQMSNLMLAIVVVTMAIALFAAIIFLIKKMPASGFLSGRFGPSARLSVLETIQVDRRRKLVLLRKDGQEFLMMVGGPTDVLVSASQSSANHMGENLTNVSPTNDQSVPADKNMLHSLAPQASDFPAPEHASEPRAMETSSDRLVVASNDEINPPVEHQANYGLAQVQAGHTAHAAPQMPRATYPQTDQIPPERFGEIPEGQDTYLSDNVGLQNQSAYSEFSQQPSYAMDHTDNQELQELLDDAMRAPKIDEEVVAEAVNLLNSEEEVTAFFDRTRSRVFQQADASQKNSQQTNIQQGARPQAQRADTDDFSAVLRSQQSATPNRPVKQQLNTQTEPGHVSTPEPHARQQSKQAAQLPLRQPAIEQNQPASQPASNRQMSTERLATTQEARLNEHALNNAEKNAKEAASRARQNASKSMQIQPLPETPEERVAKLKALLSAHQKSRPF